MNKLVYSILAILLCLTIFRSYAQEYRKLEGTYAIASATLIDPPKNEKKDRVVMLIKGGAAKEIYDGILGKAKKSLCNPEIFMKTSGNLVCTKESNFYACNIAILLKSGETASAIVC